MPSVTCPHCQKRFTGKPELSGKTVKCPACKEPFQVPQLDQPAISPELPPVMDAPASTPQANSPEVAPRTMLGTANAILHQPISGTQVWDRFRRRQMLRLYILLGLVVIVGPPLVCCGGLSMLWKSYTRDLPAGWNRPPQARQPQLPETQPAPSAVQESNPAAVVGIPMNQRFSEDEFLQLNTDIELKTQGNWNLTESLKVVSGPNVLGEMTFECIAQRKYSPTAEKQKLVVHAIYRGRNYPHWTVNKILVGDEVYFELRPARR